MQRIPEVVAPAVAAFLSSIPEECWYSGYFRGLEKVSGIIANRLCDPNWAPCATGAVLADKQFRREVFASIEELLYATRLGGTKKCYQKVKDVVISPKSHLLLRSYLMKEASLPAPPPTPVENRHSDTEDEPLFQTDLCRDCNSRKATWRFMPCKCVALCGCCVKARKLKDFTKCPVCASYNRGSFKRAAAIKYANI